MKIVCLITSLRLGGAQRQLIGLAAALGKQGHDVEVLTYHKENFYADYLAECGVEHTFIPKKNDIQIVRDIAAHLKDVQCDTLISFLAGTNIKACLIWRLYPHFRLIVSERNCNLKMRLHDRVRFALYRCAHLVVCNNYSQEAFIRRYGHGLAPKLRTIPNFVDLERFRPSGTAPEATRRIVVTARVCQRKNTLGCIEAAGLLASEGIKFRLEWYGAMEEDSYMAKCRNRIASLGLQDIFCIHEAEHDIRERYRQADIFCLPSFYEGTSNSLAEALASGLPVVCSRVSDNTRYVREDYNGVLFNPHRADDIARALRTALTMDDAALRAFGENSRKTAEALLSPDSFVQSYLKVL